MSFRKSIKRIILWLTALILTTGLLFFYSQSRVFAHEPHDVIVTVQTSPTYDQDQTVFMVIRDNLFRSSNGGRQWTRLVKGLDNLHGFTALVISQQSKSLLYLSSDGDGIYKSDDAGDTWKRDNMGLASLVINHLAISPQSVLAADEQGRLYRRTGEGWQTVLETDTSVTAIAIEPSGKGAIAGTATGQIYHSQDGGNTWTSVGTAPERITALWMADAQTSLIGTEQAGIFKTTDGGRTVAAVNQGLKDLAVYDLVGLTPTTTPESRPVIATTATQGAWLSTNGGESWQPLGEGLTRDKQADQFKQPHFRNTGLSNQFEQDGTAFVSGFNGLFKTSNGGQTWQEIPSFSPGLIIALGISPNYAEDSTLAVLTYLGEAYRSQDAGKTWTSLHKGLEIPRFTGNLAAIDPNYDQRRLYDLVFSPTYKTDQTLFASVLWTKVLRHNGQRWQITPLPKTSRSLALAPSPNFAQDQTLFVATQKGPIYRSTTGGRQFSEVGNIGAQAGNESPSLVISPAFATDQTLYITGADGVYQSVNGGRQWQSTLPPQLIEGKGRLKLAISPNYQTDQTVMVATNQSLLQTRDAGVTWTPVTSLPIAMPFVEGVAFSPDYAHDQTLLVSIRGHGLFKSSDGAQTFAAIGNSSLPLAVMNNFESSAMPLAFSPNYQNDRTLYGFGAATAAVFKSTDGGNTWETIEIPRAPIFDAYRRMQYSPWLKAQITFILNRSKLLKVGLATISGLLSYRLVELCLSNKSFRKRFPTPPRLMKPIISILVFVGVLNLLAIL